MIYVDQLRACGAPWRGGVACHMVSDESLTELLRFGRTVGVPIGWLQRGSCPHFDLSPRLRAKAVHYGAVEVDRRGIVEAVRRFRNPPQVFDHVWFWRARLPERKGQHCRVLARGKMNSIMVQFIDGERVITSRHAVRLLKP